MKLIIRRQKTDVNVNLIRPYFDLIKNRNDFIKFLSSSKNNFELLLQNGDYIIINKSEIKALQHLLAIIKYSVKFSIHNGILKISFDVNNEFTIPLNLSSLETLHFLRLLNYGLKFGVFFKNENNSNIAKYRKTINLISLGGKKVIELYNGLRFFLDSIDPWIIIETFILDIHKIEKFESLKDKTIIDIGANVGDTPLYYANQGATVYAFEPVEEHFQAMLRNIKINPNIAGRIIPVKAAVGTDGILKIHHSKSKKIWEGASVFYNVHGDDVSIDEVQGFSLQSALDKFNIKEVDLLKMDCKGCEFNLDDNSLMNIKVAKIEYTAFNSHKVEDLISLFQRNQFRTLIYMQNPNIMRSLSRHGTLLAEKQEI